MTDREQGKPGRDGEPAPGSSGAAVDSEGRAAQDPTKNVLDLVEAGMRRQDDLRVKGEEHQKEMARLRETHAREIRKAETDRLDAIRAVDVAAAASQISVAETRAATLAKTVTDSAEALRVQVSTTAAAFDAKLLLALEPITKRLEDLSRVQYEQAGQKTQVIESRESASDFAPIVETLARLERAQNQIEGAKGEVVVKQAKGANMGMIIGLGLAGFFGFFSMMIALAGIVITLTR